MAPDNRSHCCSSPTAKAELGARAHPRPGTTHPTDRATGTSTCSDSYDAGRFPHCVGCCSELELSRSRDPPFLVVFPTHFTGGCCPVCAKYPSYSHGHTIYSVFVLDLGGISPVH